ncbi:siphovirus Gp157 family protein [Natronogracilivirga saccharolytica]|uniref:Siphovirus Gp157 family protein n=1 Tax=Natronogracilivirga saccharolytica TaxID=2812953 RepID=A0A8J7RQ62_9BACT|nr:siphovirus Gp157 family protein [Natronogracilivirga saccharolytica]MBP3193894.1 siphovirus Gp157 family protein [Natronogracilivirga saccharolytica]
MTTITTNNAPKTTTAKTKESLFAIGESFAALESLIEEHDGELTETIDQWLAEYEAKQSDKIDAYCYLVEKYEEIASEARRLAQRATAYKNKASGLKERLKVYLEHQGTAKVETGRFTVSVGRNGGKLPVELHEGVAPEDLPEAFQKIRVEADKDRLRESLLNEQSELNRLAYVGDRGTHLRIT